MFELSNRTRSEGIGKSSWQNPDLGTSIGEDEISNLIARANAVPITKILNHYNIRTSHSNKLTCPFKHHKNGRESTPSFFFYTDTNTFTCFGCKAGKRPCNFVALMENCLPHEAAIKILLKFKKDIQDDFIIEEESLSEKIQLLHSLSSEILNFRRNYTSLESNLFIDKISKTFDNINEKYQLTNEGIALAIQRLIEEIKGYTNE